MDQNQDILNSSRDRVFSSYQDAINANKEEFIIGNIKATSEYIYDNQKEDAIIICNKFYETPIRAISIIKRTKVGMDGLMIEIAKNMTTHPDNNFALHRKNVFFITGMSNKSWETDLKYKMPSCFEENVYHHGKLKDVKPKLKNIENALIIIDEIDNGDKKDQKLHKTLKDSGVLDIKYMEKNNVRFIFVSATMRNELKELSKWKDKHNLYYMTIPDNYIGHKEFLDLGIIKEFYDINDNKSAEKWIQEDILQNYGIDYRVHIIRIEKDQEKFICTACKKYKIIFKNHTSDERISDEDLLKIFSNITNHIVIAVKGFYRRANLIPNEWKKKIGATHEKYVNKCDTNVQVQGLPGRMTGYWKQDILNGHKTGPYRTSIKSIKEYEEFYKNPLGVSTYSTNSSKELFLQPKNININISEEKIDSNKYRIYDNERVVKQVCDILEYEYRSIKVNEAGFKETSLNNKKKVVSLKEAIKKVPTAYGTNNKEITWRTHYPCYVDINDNKTLRYVVIIRPNTDKNLIKVIDTKYKSIKCTEYCAD